MKELIEIYKIPFVWINHLVGIFIAFLPDEFLAGQDSLKGTSSYLISFIPSTKSYVDNSSFPEVTSLYFSISSIFGLLIGVSLIKKYKLLIPEGKKVMEKWGALSFLYPIFATLVLGTFIWAAIFLPIGKPWDLIPIHSSKLALAVAGPMFSLLPFILISLEIAVLRTWIDPN